MTSSTKPEVHNLITPPAQDRATTKGNMHKHTLKFETNGATQDYENLRGI